MVVVSLIAFIFVIGIIILVHEAGHFFTARKAGIKCNEFSIGMGPVIKQWKSKETTISLRWIPLGGYVSMVDGNESDLYIELNKELGLNLESGCVSEIVCDSNMDADVKGIVKRVSLKGLHDEPLEIDLEIDGQTKTYPVLDNAKYVLDKSTKIELTPYKESFDSKKIWQRLLVLAAGAVMNFILGLIICIIASFSQGTANINTSVIGSVDAEMALGKQGVSAGDEIKSVNFGNGEIKINTWSDFSNIVSSNYAKEYKTMTMTYVHNGETKTTDPMTPYVYIIKAGLTNGNADNYTNTSGKNGVVVGEVDTQYGNNFSSGDVITAIEVSVHENGKWLDYVKYDVESWTDILKATLGTNYDGKNISTAIDNEKIKIHFLDRIEKDGVVTYSDPLVTNEYNAYSNEVLSAQGYLPARFIFGCSASIYREFGPCMSQAFAKFSSYFSQIVRTLKALLFPSNGVRSIGAKNLSSVVGIYDMVNQYLMLGPATFLFFVAMLSINIGIMNLLPIPALDGGRIIFVLYELLTGRKPNKKFETILNFIFYILLLILFIYVTYNDVLRLARK
jgi:regulator of sigma E protease